MKFNLTPHAFSLEPESDFESAQLQTFFRTCKPENVFVLSDRYHLLFQYPKTITMNLIEALRLIQEFGGKVNIEAKQIRIKKPFLECPEEVQISVNYLRYSLNYTFDNSTDKTCAICDEEIAFGEFVCTNCKLLDEN